MVTCFTYFKRISKLSNLFDIFFCKIISIWDSQFWFTVLRGGRVAQASAPLVVEPAKPYSFAYESVDPKNGMAFGHKESSDGVNIQGEYRVVLPDTRSVRLVRQEYLIIFSSLIGYLFVVVLIFSAFFYYDNQSLTASDGYRFKISTFLSNKWFTNEKYIKRFNYN